MSFRFKKFKVDDDNCAMKVGTDGVLLGAWCSVPSAGHILDVGAGSGLISLMIAQRTSDDVRIKAVEISQDAFGDCSNNFINSPWSERLESVNNDFSQIKGRYDLIVSNPPFFANQLSSPIGARALARQGETLNYISLIDFADNHLCQGGRLCFISDVRSENDIEFNIVVRHLRIVRKCTVYPKSGASAKRILWEIERNDAEEFAPKNTDRYSIILNNTDGTRHEDYRVLTDDFYL